MKSQIGSKRIICSVVLLGLVLILSFSYEAILVEAGRFLAPKEPGNADVVILENEGYIREKAVKIGIEMLSSGRANRMMVVVHRYPIDERTFAISNYPELISNNLERLGLKRDQFMILETPINHPITLTEAQTVLSSLSKRGVRSAILVAAGFHTRRSFWAYKQIGDPLGIKIIPYSIWSQDEAWWKRRWGIRYFLYESSKLFYYFLCGYISIKTPLAL